jgi:hypothetical protein
MQRVPVESRGIASIGYAPQERVLELEFRQSREIYRYFDVPSEEYTAFLAADSKGTFESAIQASGISLPTTPTFADIASRPKSPPNLLREH